jgi:hypothetical protein
MAAQELGRHPALGNGSRRPAMTFAGGRRGSGMGYQLSIASVSAG